MSLKPQVRDAIANELKTFGAKLNLSDDQKKKLQGLMTDASQKLQEYKEDNPNASNSDLLKKVSDNRATIRQHLTNILTPDQLTKWDAEVAKSKEFLGQKIAA